MLKKLPFLALLAVSGQLLAHPAPELAVRSDYDTETRTLTIRLEADPRVVFDGDPEEVPFLKSHVVESMSEEEKATEMTEVEAYVKKAVTLFFKPDEPLEPDFEWSYGPFGDGDEEITLDTDLVLHGEWKVSVPKDATGFYIAPTKGLLVAVRYENAVDGKKLERYQILFGGETSYTFGFTPPK